jgi:hypothetical protein
MAPPSQTSTADPVSSIPSSPEALTKYLTNEGRGFIRKYGLLCKIDSSGKARTGLTTAQCHEVIAFIEALSSLHGVTTDLVKKIGIKEILAIILNGPEKPNRFEFDFPEEVRDVARQAWNHFRSGLWGERADRNTFGYDSESEGTQATSTDTSTHRIPSVNLRSGANGPTSTRRPSPDDPIYGTNGIMRGILREKGPNRKEYRFGTSDTFGTFEGVNILTQLLDPEFPRRSYRVFGHNGLSIGDWWPMQICALRDGAHGVKMGGIAGTADEGAISIVVSGM